MKPLKSVLTVFVTLFLSLSLFNCGSPDDTVWTDEGGDDGNNTSEPYELQARNTNVEIGEIVIVDANRVIEEDTVYVTINENQQVDTWLLEGDSSFAFFVPELTGGLHDCAFSIESNELVIDVAEARVLQDVDTEIDSIYSKIDRLFANIEKAKTMGYSFSEIGISNSLSYYNDAKDDLKTLSDEDKKKVIRFLEANRVLEFTFNPIAPVDSFSNKKAGPENPDDNFGRFSTIYYASLTTAIISTAGVAALAYMANPSPWYMVGTAVLTAIAGTAIVATAAIAEQAGEQFGLAEELIDEINKTSIQFDLDEPLFIKPLVLYRTFKRSDKNHENEFYSTFIEKLEEFEKLYADVKIGLEKVENWLNKDLPELPDIELDIDDEPESKYLMPNFDKITIANVTNSVTLEKKIVGDRMQLIASRNLLPVDFNFRLMYTYPEYGISISEKYEGYINEPKFKYEDSWWLSYNKYDPDLGLTRNYKNMKFDADENGLISNVYTLELGSSEWEPMSASNVSFFYENREITLTIPEGVYKLNANNRDAEDFHSHDFSTNKSGWVFTLRRN